MAHMVGAAELNVASARLITLDLAKADITDALRMIASQGGLNLVVGPEITGTVTVSLNETPVADALRAVAAGNGFVFAIDRGVITVTKPPEARTETAVVPPMRTRVFRPRSVSAPDLRWALEPALSKFRDAQGQPLARITLLNEDSRSGYGINTLSAGASTGGTSSSGGTTLSSSVGGSGTAATPTTGGTAPGSTTATAAGGNDPLRSVQASQVLVVTDTEENLDEIARLIEELDQPPKQVLIEARIIEMTLTLQKQLGIDWNIEVFANGPRLQHQFPLYRRAGFARTLEGDILPALGTVDFSRFQAVLEANQDDGGIRVLANPRLLAYNNHRAAILSGEQYPILRTSVTDFGTATESFEQYIPIGVQLSVTPTILAGNRVSLLVHPATTSLGDDVVGTTGLRVARINTRELDTRVVVRDGQTIVLGGLISDRRSNEQRKVAGLGEVPVLNWLFRQERRRDERVDLMVFLTVHVEGADRVSARDREIYNTYRPHFKRTTGLKDVGLQFELPGFDQNGDRGNGAQYLKDTPRLGKPASRPTEAKSKK